MIVNLKPYPDMNDSNVEWLGELPKHWEVVPNRALFDEVRERNHPEAAMLSVTISKGVVRQYSLLAEGSKKDSSNPDKSAYKFVRPGDIVYNKMRAWQGAFGVSDHSGIISPAYVVERPRKGLGRYFHYLLRTPAFAKEAERWSYGITSDMWSLRPEHFKMIYGCFPPLSEQASIVHFLDHIDIQVRRYICAKRKLIELLEEQKRAIVQEAVIRGLDPTVGLKHSGVEWLGDVPEHWNLRPIKHWVTINADVLPETTDPNHVFLYIDIGSVGTGILVEKPQQMHFSNAPSRARRIAHTGDTLVSTVRTYLKAIYFVDGDIDQDELICSTGFAVLTPRVGTVPKFVSYLFQSNALTDRIMADSLGIAYPAIAERHLGSFIVAVPTLTEQMAIVSFLDRQTADLDAMIMSIRQEISLLGEYRTRLIADVVTGKRDVRAAADELAIRSEVGDEADAFVDTGKESVG